MTTDTELQHDVISTLQREPSLESSTIGIAAKNGVVTLSGTVRFQPQKMLAELLAKDVAGVKAVADDIDVRYPGAVVRNDTDIATAALKSLERHVSIPNRVKVTVRDGWILLEGEVNWQFQREAAADAVRYLAGVNGVNNAITLCGESRSQINE